MKQLTAKNILIKYIENKDFLVYYFTKGKCRLMDKEDYDEVFGWSEDLCKKIIQCLNTDSDSGLCPWCQIYLKDGEFCKCPYGKRHGDCLFPEFVEYGKSLYKDIIAEMGHFLEKEEFYILVVEARNLLNKMENSICLDGGVTIEFSFDQDINCLSRWVK